MARPALKKMRKQKSVARRKPTSEIAGKTLRRKARRKGISALFADDSSSEQAFEKGKQKAIRGATKLERRVARLKSGAGRDLFGARPYGVIGTATGTVNI